MPYLVSRWNMECNRSTILRTGNVLAIKGRFDLRQLPDWISEASLIEDYSRLEFDFSDCEAAFPEAMLPVCLHAIMLREKGYVVKLVKPRRPELCRLFHNSNWASLIDPEGSFPNKAEFKKHIPAVRFRTPEEQLSLVNMAVDRLLLSFKGLSRKDLAAFEWAFSEITDNVLIHASAPRGGLAQVSTYSKSKKIEFTVCDDGNTVPATLIKSHPELLSDSAALEDAIKEGVTRDKSIGQGNGLYGTSEVCRISGGEIEIYSRKGHLRQGKEFGLCSQDYVVPFSGTVIKATIDCSRADSLGQALRFGGKVYRLVDRIETFYESPHDNSLCVRLISKTPSVKSRHGGGPVRTMLYNLLKMTDGVICVDFDEVPLVSSSFADEAFGKLCVDIGELEFRRRVRFVGATEATQQIIERAVRQRREQGRGR